ncbi:MAG TPA: hypothetical protein VHR72_12560, partial [Gemmataceae bacterium]|nr:hypothetical protein [Gemmataceae bacterium]
MSRFSMIGGLLLGFAFVAAFVAADPEDARRPIPTTAATAKAEKLVKELFKADFIKTNPADRSTFAAKLLEQAENEADVAAAFVFFRDARDVAAKAGDLALYRAAAKGLARSYRIEESDALAGNIDTLATTLASNRPSPEMAREMIDCVDDAVRAGEFTAAHKLLKAAETVVRRAGAPRSAAAVAARLKSLPAVQMEFEKLAEARKALESDPADKKANLLLGKFTCFVKNDWETGLARLLLGAEGEIQLAVDKDIAAAAGKGAERIQAAD